MITLPGLIDPHVHLRDPGQTHKEDFTTGSNAAIAGGFTTILDMPNNAIPITTEQLLIKKRKIAEQKILCDIGFYFGSIGDNLNEFQKIQTKVHGLKIFLNQTTGNFLIDLEKFQQVCKAWPNHHPILLHAEENILEKALDIGHNTNQKIHVCHISSEKELRIILNAKIKGEKVTCGVTPHHLFLSNDGYTPGVAEWTPPGWMLQVKPSLKPQSDINFIWSHLKDIDVIESDHAPHTLEEKQQGAFGFPGLETTLPLLLTAAHQNRLTIEDITRLCYTNPSKIFNINHLTHPTLLKGGRGDLTAGAGILPAPKHSSDATFNDKTHIVIDESEEYTIQNQNLFTKSKSTPFNGYKVKGKIKKVYIRGTKVFEAGKILIQPGFGKIIQQNSSL